MTISIALTICAFGFVCGCALVARAIVVAGHALATRPGAPVFEAKQGGTVSVIVQDPNAKVEPYRS